MKKENTPSMSNEERYAFFISTILKNKSVWLLKAADGMYAIFEDNNDQQYIPVWPEKKYTEEFAKDEWQNYAADEMKLNEFKTWLFELKDDKIFIAAFPESSMKTIPVNPEDLINHLSV